jgi:hypothetical protein
VCFVWMVIFFYVRYPRRVFVMLFLMFFFFFFEKEFLGFGFGFGLGIGLRWHGGDFLFLGLRCLVEHLSPF